MDLLFLQEQIKNIINHAKSCQWIHGTRTGIGYRTFEWIELKAS
jgi:hypothetical protein